MARRKDSPQKAAMREMMRDYLKNNDISIKDGTDVNSIMRDMMSVLLEGALDEELNEELGYSKYDCRNKETDNTRNGHSNKTMHTSYGDMDVAIPRGCIVHQVRNTLKYVPDRDRKAFATDLKSIYQASDEKKALIAEHVTEKWTPKYPNSMKRWKDNRDAVSPIFKFSSDVRKVIYTTNAIESLNSTYRKLNRQRSVFPSDTALLKALYLATFEATKKWTATIRNWAQIYGELSIMYEGRLPE